VADCELSKGLSKALAEGGLGAEMADASIYLRREGLNTVGESVPYNEAELAGAALHELGHALGFPGHVAKGDSIMVQQLEVIVRHGEAVLEGRGFRDATLAALYSLPSGTIVGHRRVDATRLAIFWRIRRLAWQTGWQGPYVRVGERSAQLLWRGPEGEGEEKVAVLREYDWLDALRSPDSFAMIPNREAASFLLRVPAR
jgi:hypothetical protein